MTRKFITISTDACDWGDTNDAPAFDVNREVAQIRDAAQKHGISVYVDAKPPWDVADLGEEIDWFSTWCLEGYLWGDDQWSDWFASQAARVSMMMRDTLAAILNDCNAYLNEESDITPTDLIICIRNAAGKFFD